MAKRSDFTQKLLDDLRLRKEKLGFASSSQRSTTAPATPGGAYGNSRRSFQGPLEVTTNKFSGKNMADTEVTKLWIGTRHQKTTAQEGSSRDIVPFGRATNPERSVDVSMALALALSKTGKLQNIELFTNATVGNERILHRGSISFREKNGRYASDQRNSTDQYPFLSHQQISEISKGVQQLNKILETCSNGPKFNRDSIELGRQLMKGAIDLEESLRMLVSLQEASDYTVGSQGKQVRLLKDKDEDESSSNTTNRKKSTNRPRFSFDGSSRHKHEPVKQDADTSAQEQNILALAYPRKSKTPSNSNKSSSNPSMQFISHRRSQSCSPGFKPDARFSGVTSSISEEPWSISGGNNSSAPETMKQLGSKGSPACEKVRIPNVVAKLMGLEELPPPKAEWRNGEAQKVPKLKKETQIGKTLTADTGVGKKEVDVIASLQKNSYKTGGQNRVLQEKGIREAKVAHSQGKTNLTSPTDIENRSPASNYVPESHLKINKQIDIANRAHSKKDRATKKEVGQLTENVFIKEQISKAKVEHTIHDAKKPVLVNQDDAASKVPLQKYEINVQDGFSIQSNSSRTENDDVPKQISTVPGVKSQYLVNDSFMEIGHGTENKPETTITLKSDLKLKKAEKSNHEMSGQKVLSGSSVIIASKRNSLKSAKTEKPREDPKRSHQEKPKLRNRRSTYNEADRKTAIRNWENKKPTKTDPRIVKEKAMSPIPGTVMKKPMHAPTFQKVDATDTTVHRGESTRISEERSENMENPHAEGQHFKEQPSFSDELEHRWKERTNKAEGAKVSIHAMNSDEHLQEQIVSTTISHSKLTDESRNTTKTPEQRSAAETNSYTTNNVTTGTQETPQIIVSNDPERQPLKLEGKQSEGPIDRREIRNNSNLLEWQNQAVSEVDGQGSLAKNQRFLMQVLINNQHFLNTAQALFKLKIPIGFLKAKDNSCPDKDNKFLLDCGYELIRRKGKREEVTYAMSMSYAPVKVRFLDTLIKELEDDLESLKFPSIIEDNNYDTAEFLHKMVERDIQNRNPDVNCMWDLGWNSMTLAPVEKDEVIRDVEKNVLNGLINEVIKDLM